MTAILTLRGDRVALFERREEALACLPAMSRILGMPLQINGVAPCSRDPLPRGCFARSATNDARYAVVAKP